MIYTFLNFRCQQHVNYSFEKTVGLLQLKSLLRSLSFKNLSCPLNQFQNHWSGVRNMKITRSVKSASFTCVLVWLLY